MSTYAGDPKAFDIDLFTGEITGECLCGNIQVKIINKPNLFTERNGHQCFCSNCRKFSGCSGSNNMVIEQDHVRVSDPKGYLKTYEDRNTGSGKMTPRSFCGNCSSPIYSLPTDDAEDFYVLPLGIFPRIPQPKFELFSAHKHDWQAHNEGVTRYKYMSSSGEME